MNVKNLEVIFIFDNFDINLSNKLLFIEISVCMPLVGFIRVKGKVYKCNIAVW